MTHDMPSSSVDEEPAGTDGVSGLTLTAEAAVALSSAFKVEASEVASDNKIARKVCVIWFVGMMYLLLI